MENVHVCFYHKADLDGKGSAAVIKYFNPEAILIPFDYGMDFNLSLREVGLKVAELSDLNVCFVDCCLPIDEMFDLAENCKELLWIDHHISAYEQLLTKLGESSDYRVVGSTFDDVVKMTIKFGNNSLVTVFPHDIEKKPLAAIELSWLYFGSSDNFMPQAVSYLGRYDVWQFDEKKDDIYPFQMGMRSKNTNIIDADGNLSIFWKELFHNDDMTTDIIIEDGKTIIEYIAKTNSHVASNLCREGSLYFIGDHDSKEKDTYRLIIANMSGQGSKFFDSVYDPEKHDIMVSYFQRSDGKWVVSFYSDKDIDCAEIARNIGYIYDGSGGGHKGAAGCTINMFPEFVVKDSGFVRL